MESGKLAILPTAQQIVYGQGICQFLELLWVAAIEECIGTLFKIDAFGVHQISQPMVLIEANAC